MSTRDGYQIEQITARGEIVLDYDQPLSATEQVQLLSTFFGKLTKPAYGYEIAYRGTTYTLLAKTITYLGHPWPAYKKRIQVPSTWNEQLAKPTSVLLGIYRYNNHYLFCFFEKRGRGKNSAAHVSSIDLLKATQQGVFEKVDSRNNKIIVCTTSKFLSVFSTVTGHSRLTYTNEITVLSEFYRSLPRNWDGVTAYREMFASNFTHKQQAEWPGFYAEFRFEKFLASAGSVAQALCKYIQRKQSTDLDFDIDFTKAGFLGDLKTHSITSTGIPGNDKRSFLEAITKYGSLWYVVLTLRYRYDKDMNGVVTRHWNHLINAASGTATKDPLSYLGRMKYDGELVGIKILEFNQYNHKYVSKFDQGKQPGGAPRAPKIQIKRGDIDNFVIYRE